MTTDTVTTHFDYHSIDHNLLKLDILGHDDPTMIRMLQDLIGLDPVKDIPLDSREVMSLFQNTSALGITPEDIGGCKLGALGVPEFGTDFAMQMLIDAQSVDLSQQGVGMVAIAYFSNGGKTVQMEYYSTAKQKWFLDENQFTMEIDVVQPLAPAVVDAPTNWLPINIAVAAGIVVILVIEAIAIMNAIKKRKEKV